MKTVLDFRPYQQRALQFLCATPRAYLAAKAGAGKTAVALAYMHELMLDWFEVRKVLVVAPKRVVPQWPEEARKWAFGAFFEFSLYLGMPDDRKTALAAPHDVLVCSFEFFPELVKTIKAKDWQYDLVVFDEASRLRNGGRRGSVGWKAMQAIASKTQARLLLMSGSPRPGTAHELYAPVHLLDQGQRLGKTLTGFRSQYLEPNKTNRHTGQVYSWKLRAGMERALYDRIADLYFAVAPDLGLASVTVDRFVALPAEVSQACDDLQANQVLDLDELELTAASQGTVAGKLHQMCQGAVFNDRGEVVELHEEKLAELEEIINEVDGPVIVCVWYSHDRDRVLGRIKGAVDITTTEGLELAKQGRAEVAVLHPASAGHGIDGLQAHYSAIVWFAIPASFELYDQANKRIVRSGQRETVRIYRIIAANGIVDERMVQRLADKEREQDRFFDHLQTREDV
jgi:hypothetical protein